MDEILPSLGPYTKLTKTQRRRRTRKLQKERLLASLESCSIREDGNPENKEEVPQSLIKDRLKTGQGTSTTVDEKSTVRKKRQKSKKRAILRPNGQSEMPKTDSGAITAPEENCDMKGIVAKGEGYKEVVDDKCSTSRSAIIDVMAASKNKEDTEIANGEMGSSKTATCDVKAISKGEEYTKFVHGEKVSSAKATINGNSTLSKKEEKLGSKTMKPTFAEIPDPQYNLEGMHANSIVPLKRKRSKKKKPVADGMLNAIDNMRGTDIANGGLQDTPLIEGLPIQSQVHNGQEIDIGVARSLVKKLAIESVEIPKDPTLVVSSLKASTGHHVVQPKKNNVATLRRKLLILDVNGLLADIICPPPKDCKSDINILRRAIFKRPFLDDFLCFCFERFDVGIWSSRTGKILNPVVDYLLGDWTKKLLFLWDASHCTTSEARCLENKHKCIVFKKLMKIWEKGYYDESNTLLLDDSPYKALLNPKHTGIFPFSYSYKDVHDNFLAPNGDLRAYLEGIAATANVKTYVEQHPFGQRAIDENSLHWTFYSRILNGLSWHIL